MQAPSTITIGDFSEFVLKSNEDTVIAEHTITKEGRYYIDGLQANLWPSSSDDVFERNPFVHFRVTVNKEIKIHKIVKLMGSSFLTGTHLGKLNVGDVIRVQANNQRRTTLSCSYTSSLYPDPADELSRSLKVAIDGIVGGIVNEGMINPQDESEKWKQASQDQKRGFPDYDIPDGVPEDL